MAERTVKRATRVAGRVREELASLLSQRVRDPRAAGVTITRVEMPDDLRRARVFFRLLEGGDDEARRDEATKGLGRAAGMLRAEVTKKVGLRYAPELVFEYDAGQEARDRMDRLFEEIRAEQKIKDGK
jgi:ribosome-binding factor A